MKDATVREQETIAFIRNHGRPVRSQTESTGCQSRANRFWSRMLEVPVKWAFLEKRDAENTARIR